VQLAARSLTFLSLALSLAAQQPAPTPTPTPPPPAAPLAPQAPAKGEELRRAFVDPNGHRRMTIAAAADQVLAADKTGRAQFMATLRAIAAAVTPAAPAAPGTAATPAPASSSGATAAAPELPEEVRQLMATAVTGDPAVQKQTLARLAADPDAGPKALRQLDERGRAILARCVSNFVLKKLETNAIFAGQYLELLDFHPEAGELLLAWVKDAPRDIGNPQQFRTACLRALRDTLSGDAVTDRVRADLRELATKAQGGPDGDLFLTAVCALHQYGDTELFDKMRGRLEEQAKSEDEEQRVRAVAMLGDLFYQLRDYAKAADNYKAFVAMVEGFDPLPRGFATSIYNAACSLSLAGKTDEALQYLERALATGTKAGQPLPKALVDSDHDLDNLRKDPRFTALYEQYFGKGTRQGR
jgi:tetratricopeptide (TPR) repeat protein